MENHSIRNGLMYGFVAIAISLLFYFISPEILTSYSSWLTTIIGIYFMVMAVKGFKEDTEGYIGVGEAFKAAWLTFMVGTIISTIFTYVLYNIIDSSLLDLMREAQLDAIDKMAAMLNMDQSAIDSAKEGIEDSNPFDLKAVFIALPVAFLFPGAVIAIIIAAIMKKNPDNYA
ncbi:MAG: DUF4199 domain-containing protein [Saprospiraceae bacterium]|nr:DUF4199 domain-containing protein [Saprospiraceae bacterium]